jgi:anti-sigma B factor antagonist
MELTQREDGDVTVITLTGRLTVNDKPGLLKGAVATAVGRGAKHVVLDLSSVKYIDSTRLGELIAAHVTLSRQGGRLSLAGVPARVAELLGMAGLDGVFSRYGSVGDAITGN